MVSTPTTRARVLPLLGPAFVAAIAYVDPGNVAANITAGSRYGFLLVWVLVVANAMAVLVQYQSAKLGLVTGATLPELLGRRLRRPTRLAFWAQAEVVAAATDLAEVIGEAIALYLLFGTPLLAGGVIVGVVSLGLLAVQNRYGQRHFETVVIARRSTSTAALPGWGSSRVARAGRPFPTIGETYSWDTMKLTFLSLPRGGRS